MSRNLIGLIAGAVVLVLGLLWWQGRARDASTRFEQAARAAEDSAAVWKAAADSGKVEADSAHARRERAEQRADLAEARADSIRVIRGEVRTRIVTVEVPADALPFTAPRDTLIALLTAENTELRLVVAAKDTALAEASTEATSLRQANALLEQSVGVLEEALAMRPSRRWWVPKITAGYSAIVDRQTREIRDGPGISLGWEVSVF